MGKTKAGDVKKSVNYSFYTSVWSEDCSSSAGWEDGKNEREEGDKEVGWEKVSGVNNCHQRGEARLIIPI